MLVALALPGVAAAQLYKCTENGKVTYRERPCDTGTADRIDDGDTRAASAPGHPKRQVIRRNPQATIAPAAPQHPRASADASVNR
jgi:hypothetical protein